MTLKRPHDRATELPAEIAVALGTMSIGNACAATESLVSGSTTNDVTTVSEYVKKLISQAPSLSTSQRAIIRDCLGNAAHSASSKHATGSPPSKDRNDDVQDRPGAA